MIVPVSAVVGRFVASARSKAGVASDAPSASSTPPKETVELTSEAFATLVSVFAEPSIDLPVRVCASDEPTTSPVGIDLPRTVVAVRTSLPLTW